MSRAQLRAMAAGMRGMSRAKLRAMSREEAHMTVAQLAALLRPEHNLTPAQLRALGDQMSRMSLQGVKVGLPVVGSIGKCCVGGRAS